MHFSFLDKWHSSSSKALQLDEGRIVCPHWQSSPGFFFTPFQRLRLLNEWMTSMNSLPSVWVIRRLMNKKIAIHNNWGDVSESLVVSRVGWKSFCFRREKRKVMCLGVEWALCGDRMSERSFALCWCSQYQLFLDYVHGCVLSCVDAGWEQDELFGQTMAIWLWYCAQQATNPRPAIF